MNNTCFSCETFGAACPLNSLKWKLYYCFEIAEAYYEIDTSLATISCFMLNGILWGKLTAGYVNKINWKMIDEEFTSYIWDTKKIKLQHYFDDVTRTNKEERITNLMKELNGADNVIDFSLAAIHGIYFK